MITSKQRSYLRGIANNITPIFHIGKSGLTPEITEGINVALEAREIVKISILNNCMENPKEVADILHERTHSEIVQVIGRKITLFKQSSKKPVIELPK